MVVPDLEAMPENLLRSPLDFLFADHFRQMLVCNFLDALAANPKIATSARMAKAARDYLAQELPLHIADENDDLFPRLMRVTAPDDRFSNIYTLLLDEHREDIRLAEPLIDGLDQIVDGRSPPCNFAPAVAAFTATQRRHIIWENSVLLPQARLQLPEAELKSLGRAMAARRGVEYPD